MKISLMFKDPPEGLSTRQFQEDVPWGTRGSTWRPRRTGPTRGPPLVTEKPDPENDFL